MRNNVFSIHIVFILTASKLSFMHKLVLIQLFILISAFTVPVNAQCISGDCVAGYGTFIYPSGAKYSGQFLGSKIHGYGTLVLKNGDAYICQWVNNYREGNGKIKYANGDEYKGAFLHSKIEGQGHMVYALGGNYNGEWKNNLPEGKGVYTYANGEKYEGQLYQGKRDGYGKYYYEDQSYYEGQWKENERDGQGVLVSMDGKRSNGIWKDDQFIENNNEAFIASARPQTVTSSPGTVRLNSNTTPPSRITSNSSPNASSTPGTTIGTVPLKNCNESVCNDEIGVYQYKDGSKYVGPFKNGNPYGKGIVYYANGDRYEGDWDDVAPDGQGIMYFTSGRIYAAIWDKGRPIKQLENRMVLPSHQSNQDKNEEVKIWAVVIGVARYDHMPVLKYADDDAYQIYAFLKSPEGGALPDNQIKVLIDEDATRANIISSIQEIFGKADENDEVILYYSGHGVNGAFLPIDFDGYNNKLYHDEISELLESSHARHKLCLIDACYAGGMMDPKADFSSSLNKYYSILNKEQGGAAFILSCKNREVSLEDGGLRQGIFSHYLIRGLKGEADLNRDKIVTVQELFNFINSQVKTYTGNAQNPLIEGKYNPNMPVASVRLN
jgi:hypothetical protein